MDEPVYLLNDHIEDSIFRAYDIRGIADETLTENDVYTLGYIIAIRQIQLGNLSINLARDGRLSAERLGRALKAGLLAGGINVVNLGAIPTPLLYYATHVLSSPSGIMLTGSHNPKHYNGLKIISNQTVLAEEAIQALKPVRNPKPLHAPIPGKTTHHNILQTYIDDVCQRITLDRPLKIVIDCGNGIAGPVATQLYQQLGCEVIELYCEVDGNFPNHHPNPGDDQNLSDLIYTVKQHQADIGLAFDGDGDRLGVVGPNGQIIRADQLMMLFSEDVLTRHPNTPIIYDVKCSHHLHDIIVDNHGIPIMWKTGHALIRHKLQKEGALLAGEISGHIFFLDNWYGFDDGLYVGARLLALLSAQAESLPALFNHFPKTVSTPEIMIDVGEERKFDLMNQLHQINLHTNPKKITIDGLRLEFTSGWGLVRASNTSPCLTLRFEATDQAELVAIQNVFRSMLHDVDETLAIPF